MHTPIVVCYAVKDLPVAYCPSTEATCQYCGQKIWFSIDTQNIVIEDYGHMRDLVLVCNECSHKIPDDAEMSLPGFIKGIEKLIKGRN